MGRIMMIALYFVPLLFSLCFHEYAHAWVAYRLGDPTPKTYGRLTLDPRAHIDWVWTIIIPLITLLIGGVYFGAGKPVPVDSRNFKNPKRDMALVALAGPLSNILLAVIFAILIGIILRFTPTSGFIYTIVSMLRAGIMVSLFLAFFNLLPLYPLDGSRILALFLSEEQMLTYMRYVGPYSMLIVAVLWMTGALNYILGVPVIVTNNILVKLIYFIMGL